MEKFRRESERRAFAHLILKYLLLLSHWRKINLSTQGRVWALQHQHADQVRGAKNKEEGRRKRGGKERRNNGSW